MEACLNVSTLEWLMKQKFMSYNTLTPHTESCCKQTVQSHCHMALFKKQKKTYWLHFLTTKMWQTHGRKWAGKSFQCSYKDKAKAQKQWLWETSQEHVTKYGHTCCRGAPSEKKPLWILGSGEMSTLQSPSSSVSLVTPGPVWFWRASEAGV